LPTISELCKTIAEECQSNTSTVAIGLKYVNASVEVANALWSDVCYRIINERLENYDRQNELLSYAMMYSDQLKSFFERKAARFELTESAAHANEINVHDFEHVLGNDADVITAIQILCSKVQRNGSKRMVMEPKPEHMFLKLHDYVSQINRAHESDKTIVGRPKHIDKDDTGGRMAALVITTINTAKSLGIDIESYISKQLVPDTE
jgi:hypothetical protein